MGGLVFLFSRACFFLHDDTAAIHLHKEGFGNIEDEVGGEKGMAGGWGGEPTREDPLSTNETLTRKLCELWLVYPQSLS